MMARTAVITCLPSQAGREIYVHRQSISLGVAIRHRASEPTPAFRVRRCSLNTHLSASARSRKGWERRHGTDCTGQGSEPRPYHLPVPHQRLWQQVPKALSSDAANDDGSARADKADHCAPRPGGCDCRSRRRAPAGRLPASHRNHGGERFCSLELNLTPGNRGASLVVSRSACRIGSRVLVDSPNPLKHCDH